MSKIDEILSQKIGTVDKNEFPEQLKQITGCPDKLYYRGTWNNDIFKNSLAVVGSRKMSRYGKNTIDHLMPDLVANKLTIISGFMYGVDSAAHKSCLDLGGKTVAVLGGGLNVITPSENADLYLQICMNGGIIISEYEPNFTPTLWTFPQRNRIVAGLTTKGTLVIEAGLKSGSLITAKLTRKYGKPVWAIPGPIDSEVSEGNNYMIKTGDAKMFTSIEDIITSDVVISSQLNMLDVMLSDTEKQITATIKSGWQTVDEITRESHLGLTEVSIALAQLSLKGLIEEEAGKIFLCRG
jgi:DNA processing protein